MSQRPSCPSKEPDLRRVNPGQVYTLDRVEIRKFVRVIIDLEARRMSCYLTGMSDGHQHQQIDVRSGNQHPL